MRIRLAAPLAFAVAVVLVAGCEKDTANGAAQDTPSVVDPGVSEAALDLTAGTAAGEVKIVLACQPPRGANFRLAPWSVEMESRDDSIGWTLIGGQPDGVTKVVITPADPTRFWPFANKAIDVPSGTTVWVKNPQGPRATYKYKVTGICYRGSVPKDTVIIDPDLIIPD